MSKGINERMHKFFLKAIKNFLKDHKAMMGRLNNNTIRCHFSLNYSPNVMQLKNQSCDLQNMGSLKVRGGDLAK